MRNRPQFLGVRNGSTEDFEDLGLPGFQPEGEKRDGLPEFIEVPGQMPPDLIRRLLILDGLQSQCEGEKKFRSHRLKVARGRLKKRS